MFSQRLLARTPRNAFLPIQTRSAVARSILQRRFASFEGQPNLSGAADNAFNRQRQAVKAHAAATSGLYPLCQDGARQLGS